MTRLTREILAGVAPRPPRPAAAATWEAYVAALVSDETHRRLEAAGMLAPAVLPHVLAQWAHETGGWTVLWESMDYGAERIGAVFGPGRHSAAVGPDEARRLAHRPEALAERVYGLGNPAKAAELGNTEPGDGFRFRGFGIQQVTGRRDHVRLLGGATTIEAGIAAAIREWTEKRCNEPAQLDDIVRVTRRINGGLNGLADRRACLARARAALAAATRAGADVQASPPVVAAAGDGDRHPANVRLGDNGEAVRRLQQGLARAGYACGRDDGAFGRRTEAALAGFQVNAGLRASGGADALTWEALEAAEPPPPRDVALADLRAGRSRQVALGDRLRRWGLAIKGLFGGAMAGEAMGLAPVEHGLSALEQARGMAGRLAEALGLAIEPKWLALAALAGAGLALWRWGGEIQANRLAEARDGANLSK